MLVRVLRIEVGIILTAIFWDGRMETCDYAAKASECKNSTSDSNVVQTENPHPDCSHRWRVEVATKAPCQIPAPPGAPLHSDFLNENRHFKDAFHLDPFSY